MGKPVHGRGPSRQLVGVPKIMSETSRSSLKGIPSLGGTEPLGPIEQPWHPLEKPSSTFFGVCLWTTSRPLSNGARASTWTYLITAHRKCHHSRPPRVAWHIPPLLPNEKDA